MKARAIDDLARRNVAPLMALVPLKMRARVERLARRKRVSLASVVRRAIADHVTREGEAKR
jgi:hypothetical protein